MVNLSEANLKGTHLKEAMFGFAKIKNTNIDAQDISKIALDAKTDLLCAKWETLIVDDRTYHRKDVESGYTPLPFGMGERLTRSTTPGMGPQPPGIPEHAIGNLKLLSGHPRSSWFRG